MIDIKKLKELIALVERQEAELAVARADNAGHHRTIKMLLDRLDALGDGAPANDAATPQAQPALTDSQITPAMIEAASCAGVPHGEGFYYPFNADEIEYALRAALKVAAPAQCAAPDERAPTAEAIADVIQNLMGEHIIDWVPQGADYEGGDDGGFNSNEAERAFLIHHVHASIAAQPAKVEAPEGDVVPEAAKQNGGLVRAALIDLMQVESRALNCGFHEQTRFRALFAQARAALAATADAATPAPAMGEELPLLPQPASEWQGFPYPRTQYFTKPQMIKAMRDVQFACIALRQPAQHIPGNFTTHRAAWREGLEFARDASIGDGAAYWEHEIAAYDRAFSRLLDKPEAVCQPAPAQPVAAQGEPKQAAREAATRKVLDMEGESLHCIGPLPNLVGEKPSGQVYGIIDPDYGRIYTMVRKLAWEEGYAIGLHGSFTRDLDMIAVPWESGRRCNPEKLVARILQATGLREAHGNPGEKSHGRKVWTLLLPEFGDPRFVDLSIMPLYTAPPPAPVAAPEPVAPAILEAMSYHANEHDDLTLEDAVKAFRFGWKEVRGRSEREMLAQIIVLLASAPAVAEGWKLVPIDQPYVYAPYGYTINEFGDSVPAAAPSAPIGGSHD